ncbi:hypothetical protein IQ254_07540 [Nodosilinea sp. LEGE 07088]|uniref:hypothetical protein n=1 Tax=Nodosilinea sp. LEGE 07088 TaxID=2777968 RepID=UPI0018820BAD|nr:hypothetical protein [Nodosilinea sp. LEGE 07088]MBE9137054.1 hypothetical protein [Nodosilinea sp. LEGE 07088]
MKWKIAKWWLIGFLALLWALWVGGGYMPAQANSTYQDTFKIGGDVVVAESQTVNDAFVIGGDLTVQPGAIVQGDAFAIGGNLRLEDNAQVAGDAFAVGGQVIRSESAVVNGSEFTVLENFGGMFDRFGVLGTLYLGNVAIWAVTFVVAAIAGCLLLLLLPGHVDAIAAAVQARPFMSLVYGIGGFIGLIVLTVLVSGSVVGAIVIPLANIAILLTWLLGGISMSVWLGRRLRARQPDARFQHFWLGLFLLFVISLIPIAGGLLVSLITLFGFGATLLSRFGVQTANTLPIGLDRLEHQPE